MISTTGFFSPALVQSSMVSMGRMVNHLKSRIDSLLSAEKSALETVEEAQRKARGIKNAIPGEVTAIEEEYENELDKFEKMGIEKVDDELEELRKALQTTLEEKKRKLDEASPVLAPRALELIREAVESERG